LLLLKRVNNWLGVKKVIQRWPEMAERMADGKMAVVKLIIGIKLMLSLEL